MSVVGIDLGTSFSKVAVAFRQQISIVPNDLSKLQTPTLVGFTEGERAIGEAAFSSWSRNYKNTIEQAKRLLGRQIDDPKLQEEISDWFLFNTCALPDNKIGVNVITSQGKQQLAPEQILGAYLSTLKQYTSNYLEGIPTKDCVITCPAYFDDAQRRAILTAARLAELNVLRLLNDTTATALSYGLLRDLPTETRTVVFVDIGYANTQVAVVDFVSGKLTVRGTACNAYCGGRDFDLALFKHFKNQFETQHKISLKDRPKSIARLQREVNRMKKILSGNRDAVFPLECFVDEIDFTLKINREEFEGLCGNVLEQMLEPIKSVLSETKIEGASIHSVEIVGGCSRIPMVQNKLLEFFKTVNPNITNLSTTLNGDEAIARGAALMCAMISPNFKVREFQVQDINTWPVTIQFQSEDSNNMTERLILGRNTSSPCTAKITFKKKDSFDIQLRQPDNYSTDNANITMHYPFKTDRTIGQFKIQLTKLNPNQTSDPKVKLMVTLNRHGLLDLPKATLIEWVKEEIQNTNNQQKISEDNSKPAPMDIDEQSLDKKNTDTTSNINAEIDQPQSMDIDQQVLDTSKTELEQKQSEESTNIEKPKEKKITTSVSVYGKFNNEITNELFNNWAELEAKMANQDRIIFETHEKRNELEANVYTLRGKLEKEYSEYVSDQQKEQILQQLDELESWLYSEGEEANKTTFIEKNQNLQEIYNLIANKYSEGANRQEYITNLKKLIFKYQQFCDSENELYSHITNEEKEKVKKLTNDTDQWLINKLTEQDRLPKYENPILLIRDIQTKQKELSAQCEPILSKPKPQPPKEDDKKKDEIKPNEQQQQQQQPQQSQQPSGDNTQPQEKQEGQQGSSASQNESETKFESQFETKPQTTSHENNEHFENIENVE